MRKAVSGWGVAHDGSTHWNPALMSRSILGRVIFVVGTVGFQACGLVIAPASEVGKDVRRRRSCAGRRPGACAAARDREPDRCPQLVWVREHRRAGPAGGRSGLRAAGVPVFVRKMGITDIAGQGDQLQGRLLAQRFTGRCFAQVLTNSRGWARETCNLVGYGQLAKKRGGLTDCEHGNAQCNTATVALRYRGGWPVW
jgi:hypothetical protein